MIKAETAARERVGRCEEEAREEEEEQEEDPDPVPLPQRRSKRRRVQSDDEAEPNLGQASPKNTAIVTQDAFSTSASQTTPIVAKAHTRKLRSEDQTVKFMTS
jgi:hypothetical protein